LATNCEKIFIASKKKFSQSTIKRFSKRENESRGLILDLDEWNE